MRGIFQGLTSFQANSPNSIFPSACLSRSRSAVLPQSSFGLMLFRAGSGVAIHSRALSASPKIDVATAMISVMPTFCEAVPGMIIMQHYAVGGRAVNEFGFTSRIAA